MVKRVWVKGKKVKFGFPLISLLVFVSFSHDALLLVVVRWCLRVASIGGVFEEWQGATSNKSMILRREEQRLLELEKIPRQDPVHLEHSSCRVRTFHQHKTLEFDNFYSQIWKHKPNSQVMVRLSIYHPTESCYWRSNA
ncbi:uncharacterized protein LOC106765177 isoform X2 [Vigna radiata var. radiata]|uniref:Uncharacterized protein LOC106765177 isoform X2 n=1 Tax=Vigna radiata var. radiata TaxID=3916 RepID=A0A1S3UGW1_VIGRR|nr:uncharacterized protein LOC106765177 isoform X2 [Vigna radiata var. radiata]